MATLHSIQGSVSHLPLNILFVPEVKRVVTHNDDFEPSPDSRNIVSHTKWIRFRTVLEWNWAGRGSKTIRAIVISNYTQFSRNVYLRTHKHTSIHTVIELRWTTEWQCWNSLPIPTAPPPLREASHCQLVCVVASQSNRWKSDTDRFGDNTYSHTSDMGEGGSIF